MAYRIARVTLAAVSAIGGVAIVTPPAIGAPITDQQYQIANLRAQSAFAAIPAYADALPVSAGEPPSKYADIEISYYTFVANSGTQAEVNACTGGLTYFPSVSEYLGRAYYPIHNECGGRPILKLVVDDYVFIADVGIYQVVAIQDVSRGDTASALVDMPGQIFLQTCHDTGNKMRVVSLGLAS
ncbi:MAG: hypothetical protein FWG25_00345 [Promicromonosporaceae bacterium]|nr:hypothetical protein [Promicromonosporaceae bacterium]